VKRGGEHLKAGDPGIWGKERRREDRIQLSRRSGEDRGTLPTGSSAGGVFLGTGVDRAGATAGLWGPIVRVGFHRVRRTTYIRKNNLPIRARAVADQGKEISGEACMPELQGHLGIYVERRNLSKQ